MSDVINSILTVLAGAADALLLGAPSSAVQSMLQEKYGLNYVNAVELYNRLNNIYQQDSEALNDLKNRRADLDSIRMNYPQLTLLIDKIEEQRQAIRPDINALHKKVVDDATALTEASNKVAEASSKLDEMSFGTVAKKYLEGKPI